MGLHDEFGYDLTPANWINDSEAMAYFPTGDRREADAVQ